MESDLSVQKLSKKQCSSVFDHLYQIVRVDSLLIWKYSFMVYTWIHSPRKRKLGFDDVSASSANNNIDIARNCRRPLPTVMMRTQQSPQAENQERHFII